MRTRTTTTTTTTLRNTALISCPSCPHTLRFIHIKTQRNSTTIPQPPSRRIGEEWMSREADVLENCPKVAATEQSKHHNKSWQSRVQITSKCPTYRLTLPKSLPLSPNPIFRRKLAPRRWLQSKSGAAPGLPASGNSSLGAWTWLSALLNGAPDRLESSAYSGRGECPKTASPW